MSDLSQLSIQLEEYLDSLRATCTRWTQWILQQEQALIAVQPERIQLLESSAASLDKEISWLTTSRGQLLELAQSLGLRSPSLRVVAQQLPSWSRPDLRASFSAAQKHLDQLKRIHHSSWILLHQQMRFCHDSLLVMTKGTARQDVYTSTDRSDMAGGQLLDTNL